MQEYCTYKLGLRFCQLASASACEGTCLHVTLTMTMYFLNVEIFIHRDSRKIIIISIHTRLSVALVLAKNLPVQLQRPVVHY